MQENAVFTPPLYGCADGKGAKITRLLVYRSLDDEQLPLDQIKNTVSYLESLDLELVQYNGTSRVPLGIADDVFPE